MSSDVTATGRVSTRRARALWRVALLVLSILIYGAAIPVRQIQLTRYEPPLAGLGPELSGLRIVQLSDLHSSFVVGAGQVQRAVATANSCDPDLVVITGDFVSFRSLKHMERAAEQLQGLRTRYGVLACLGNHEHWEGVKPVVAALDGVGVRVLVNDSVPVTGNLWLAAIDDMVAGQPDLARASAGVPEGAAVVLLSHNPMVLPQVSDRPWLVLAGHTHGGQVALPFLGPRRTIALPGVRAFTRLYESLGVTARKGRLEAVATYRYPEGWYEEGRARMYVNRGVGVNPAWPVRLNCPPEVALFVLRPEDSSGQRAQATARQ
jgi:predicted MPP superfamily phosphohydrolase